MKERPQYLVGETYMLKERNREEKFLDFVWEKIKNRKDLLTLAEKFTQEGASLYWVGGGVRELYQDFLQCEKDSYKTAHVNDLTEYTEAKYFHDLDLAFTFPLREKPVQDLHTKQKLSIEEVPYPRQNSLEALSKVQQNRKSKLASSSQEKEKIGLCSMTEEEKLLRWSKLEAFLRKHHFIVKEAYPSLGSFSLQGYFSRDIKENTFSQLRMESGYQDGRHPTKIIWVDKIEEDLKRRDFTCNALAIDLYALQRWKKQKNARYSEKIFWDCFEGRRHIEEKILVMIGQPELRLKEDYIRCIRALRLACRSSYRLEEGLHKALYEQLLVLKPEHLRSFLWRKESQALFALENLFSFAHNYFYLFQALLSIGLPDPWKTEMHLPKTLLVKKLEEDKAQQINEAKVWTCVEGEGDNREALFSTQDFLAFYSQLLNIEEVEVKKAYLIYIYFSTSRMKRLLQMVKAEDFQLLCEGRKKRAKLLFFCLSLFPLILHYWAEREKDQLPSYFQNIFWEQEELAALLKNKMQVLSVIRREEKGYAAKTSDLGISSIDVRSSSLRVQFPVYLAEGSLLYLSGNIQKNLLFKSYAYIKEEIIGVDFFLWLEAWLKKANLSINDLSQLFSEGVYQCLKKKGRRTSPEFSKTLLQLPANLRSAYKRKMETKCWLQSLTEPPKTL